jgi:phosphatidylglycerophosphate synthase
MVDSALRSLIDPPLNAAGRVLAGLGVGANAASLLGLVIGVAGAAAIAVQEYGVGVVLILLNRLIDGLDGAIARARGLTDFGGYLDIFADFVFYAAVPVGFAMADPANQLAAAVLLASFIMAGTSFLAWAVFAAKRGLTTRAQGEKSFYYMAGLAEGTETIVVFVACALRPDWFPVVAFGYAVLCVITGFARLALAWRVFGRQGADS